MPTLVCFGNPAVDFIHSSKGTFMHAGSPTMNTAVNFVQLGGTAGIIGRIGKDRYGSFLLSELKKFGVDISRLRVDNKPTNIVDVKIKNKERIIIPRTYYLGVGKLASADTKYVKESDAVLLRLRITSVQEFELVKKAGKRLYISAHFYNKSPEQSKFDLRKYKIAAIIGNNEEIAAVKRFCRFSKSTPIIMTDGDKGSYAIINRKRFHVPAFKVKAVDTTGAGDAFTAGYIFADLKGLEIEERLRFANACGAIAVQGLGAQQNITSSKIEKLLADR